MKKFFIYFSVLAASVLLLSGCNKNGNYPGDTLSPYIAIYDIKTLYKGSDVSLTKENLGGANKLAAMVVSDHSGKNLPAGLLIVQDNRRLSLLRGIAVNIGNDAANYVPGDSVIINIEGGTLTRANGILQITNIPSSAVSKISSGNSIVVNRVTTSQILAKPGDYESVLSVIVKVGFNPLPKPTDTYSGDKVMNDGFGDLTLRTDAGATFAGSTLPFYANFTGITFNTVVGKDSLAPHFRIRKQGDIIVLSSSMATPDIIISGFLADVAGGDGNYEYTQLIATLDINFAVQPYSVVVTNNANASTPTGFPANGWAAGGLRTYKMNLTSGSVKKGEYFYVGGSNQTINGASSTSMASSKWIRSYNYSTTGGDGFGTATSGLYANSGNASGVAVFKGTDVTAASVPLDVIFVGTGGSLYTPGPPAVGYRITNTDWYDIKNPITLVDQPFYRSGSNTLNLAYPTADLGYFQMLGGEYNITLGKWTKARFQTNYLLSKTSAVSEIETTGATKIIN
ncbi:MAG: hypothetical protein JWN76_442 [Chitinophagaceae bacterium]|nr:hypothetical protein [Chitinophagaceae bacterium]